MARASMDGERTAGKIVENTPDRPSFRPLLGELLRRPQYPRKAFVDNADTSEPALSDGLAGRKALDIDLLAAQDDAFLLDFIEGVIALRQLTPEAKRLIRADLLAELTRQLHLCGDRGDERRTA